MRNKLTDLNNILFENIECLIDESLTADELDREIKRSDAIQRVARNIIDTASLALQAQKHFDEYGIDRKVPIPLLEINEA